MEGCIDLASLAAMTTSRDQVRRHPARGRQPRISSLYLKELGRKVRQTLPTLLFVDPAGGKVKKCALLLLLLTDRQTEFTLTKTEQKNAMKTKTEDP